MTKPSSRQQRRHHRPWKPSFPYEADYNDHFETPLQAYQDLKPLLDWIQQTQDDDDDDDNGDKGSPRNNMTLYDPYYCNGQAAVYLRQIGFRHVVHEKRDFYKDIREKTIPEYDVLVTNPPYSDKHKRQCLAFCLDGLLSSKNKNKKCFCVLLPDYVAAREYYQKLLDGAGVVEQDNDCIVYLVPRQQQDYNYDHPEGTGKETPPFRSMWYCGIGRERYKAIRTAWDQFTKVNPALPDLYTSLKELQDANIISTQKRPNPKQRQKKRKQRQEEQLHVVITADQESSSSLSSANTEGTESTSRSSLQPTPGQEEQDKLTTVKKSKYRDVKGKRTKKRF